MLTPSGADKWWVPTHDKTFFDFEMVLPAGVTCSQCIIQVLRNSYLILLYLFTWNSNHRETIKILYLRYFQWTYVAANSWGRADNGTECVGCGPQENFRACADIEIK